MNRRFAIYGLSLAALILAIVTRWFLDAFLGNSSPFITIFGAIAFALWLDGFRPAVFVAFIGYFTASYLFIEPRGYLGFDAQPNVLSLFDYLVTCCIIVGFGESMRNVQRRLFEQSERFRTMLASINDAVISTDIHGAVSNMNCVAEKLTGWNQAEARGNALGKVYHIVNEQSRIPVDNVALASLRKDATVGPPNEAILISKDGSERPIEACATCMHGEDEQIAGSILIFRDITERRELEKQNPERLALVRFLASIIESSEDAIISKSLEGIIQSWNISAERLFGFTADEAIGRHISLVIPPERAREEDLIISRIRAGERVEHFETVRVRKNGPPIHVSLTISPIKDESGRVVGASKIARDITEHKRSEEKLRENEVRLQFIMDSMTQKIFTTGPEGVIDYFNPAWAEFTGLPLEQIKERGWTQLMHPDDIKENIQMWSDSISAGMEFVVEHRLRRADGQYRWHISRAVPMRDDMGNIVMWIGSDSDIHDAKEEARRKDEFLATLAHELRNPLAPLLNAVHLLQTNNSTVSDRESAKDVIRRQLQAMTHLIDDLLDVSRISRDKLQLRRERLELGDIVSGALETSLPLVEECGHELEVDFPSDPIFLNGDLTRLTQVFLNLINNAAKYTDRGGRIVLTAERQGSDVFVSVKDTGIGIPPSNLSTIFEMFTQVEGALSRSQGGLGIGLCLVRRLVEMHGGTIEARSEGLGCGSEFIVRLPILLDQSHFIQKVRDESLVSTSKLKILVVDDNRDAAASLGMLLKAMGNRVRVSYDGEDALRTTEEFRPDVVLLDIGLPKLNGYEACRRIRQQRWGKEIVLIALTGWGQDDDKRKAREAGFDRHFVKPLEPSTLMKLLAELEGFGDNTPVQPEHTVQPIPQTEHEEMG